MEDLLHIIKCSISETNWYYKGEGNANLIIAMKNEPKVIRISKYNSKEVNTNCKTGDTNINLNISQIKKEYLKYRQKILYYEKVIEPLFTNFYFQIPKLGFVNKKENEILNKKLKYLRPHFRQNKIIQPGFVTIFTDLTLLPEHLSWYKKSNIDDKGDILNCTESKNEANVISVESFYSEKEKTLEGRKSLDQGKKTEENTFEEINVSWKFLLSEFKGDKIQDNKLDIKRQDREIIIRENTRNDSEHENNTGQIKTLTDNIDKDCNPMYCIEIKPKQGWLAYPDRQFSKCTFCLNQYLKLSEKSVSTQSKYCPLDLYSGNQHRMIRAIKGLLSTPQNNIRIFQNGKLIWGENSNENIHEFLENFSRLNLIKNKSVENIDNFCSLILNMLTKNMTDTNASNDCLFNHLIGYESQRKQPVVDHTSMEAKFTSLIKNTHEENIRELINVDKTNRSMQTIQQTSASVTDKLNINNRQVTSVNQCIGIKPKQNLELICSETNNSESKSKTLNEMQNKSIEMHPNKIEMTHNRIPVHLIQKLKKLLLPISCCDFSTEKLPLNSLLDIILKIQKLDIYGADYVYNLYKNPYCKVDISPSDKNGKVHIGINKSDFQSTVDIVDPNEAYSSSVKEMNKPYDELKINKEIHKDVSDTINENFAKVSLDKMMKEADDYVGKLISSFPSPLSPLERYVLSTMAKDCSILITFQQINNNKTSIPIQNIEKDLVGNEFVFNVNIADVDAKPLSSIEKHFKRDNAIVHACVEILEKNQVI